MNIHAFPNDQLGCNSRRPRCIKCERRFYQRFGKQSLCTRCWGDQRRASMARIQPDLRFGVDDMSAMRPELGSRSWPL
jgi:hypothetical protein